MKWIVKIKEVKPYIINCIWNDGVEREIDLSGFISEKARNPKNSYAQLLDKKRFDEVKCDGTTLYWENGLQFEDYDGKLKPGPLDIAPEVLFEMTAEGRKIKKTA